MALNRIALRLSRRMVVKDPTSLFLELCTLIPLQGIQTHFAQSREIFHCISKILVGSITTCVDLPFQH